MTKKEKDYLKYIQQIEEFKRKAQETKEELERERDALVVAALKAREISRAEGEKLAKLIRSKDGWAQVMAIHIMPEKIVRDMGNEEETESEDEVYEDE